MGQTTPTGTADPSVDAAEGVKAQTQTVKIRLNFFSSSHRNRHWCLNDNTAATINSTTTTTNISSFPLTSSFESNIDVANNSNSTSHGLQTAFQPPSLPTTTNNVAATTATAAADPSVDVEGVRFESSKEQEK